MVPSSVRKPSPTSVAGGRARVVAEIAAFRQLESELCDQTW